ncbi:MAG: bifunctional serine/threonine-protein kinase/formylglycine-generating enzyme family protein [Labilithrix sp.]
MTLEDPLSLVGTTVSDKYEIERVVGEGGFALVYRAMHRVWKRPVALKVFRALGDLPADKRAGLVESFIQEGRLLADLSERSAAICQARDVGTLRTPDNREMPYMILEWLEGQTLEQVIEVEKQRMLAPRTADQVVRLLEPAAEALALAHRKGIAHRDVKPANIFVLGDPRGELSVKLLDFGIAKVVQDAQRLGGSFNQTSGQVSSFTPAYGAPEQFSRSHGATGPWTDVFALGLIFTELMTNRPALFGDDLTQLAFCAMDPRRRPTPRTYGASIPDALESVLRRALAVETAERFQTMGDFWEAVRASLGMEQMRAFSGGDSSRVSSPGSAPNGPNTPVSAQFASQTSLAPGLPVGATSTGPTSVSTNDMTGPVAPPSYRQATMKASGQNEYLVPSGAIKPARSNGSLPIVLGVIGGVVLLGAIGGAVVALRTKKGVDPMVTTTSASASTVASPPPPAKCPPGMIKIPGGKYFMGSDDKREDTLPIERPAHQVTLSSYCMDTTEVTVEAYKACSDRGECKRAPTENEWDGIDDKSHKLYDPLCNIRDPEAKAKHPINCVDWELADAFCKASGKRLPTEAEWEFATRGSDGRKYPWGDETPSSGTFLNACGKECVEWGKKHPDPDNPLVAMYPANDSWANTAPVGSFPKGASQFGLQDVVGNVWEWVSDWKAPYTTDAQTDPKGPEVGTEKVLRGGAWNGSDPAWVRPSYRFALDPKLRSHGIGMRCAQTL